jgi:hypothetical protein
MNKVEFVIPGLVPGIHVFLCLCGRQDVDGRDKPGHDVVSALAVTHFGMRCGVS